MNDDATDIRLLLQGVLVGREPDQRDLAGPAVSSVLAGRKRMRTLTYSVSAVAVVAMAGAVAFGVTGSDTGRKAADHVGPTAPATTTADPGPAGAGSHWAKAQDILDRLPGLVNAVLPAGYRLGAVNGELNGPSFVLTGPTGTNSVSLTAERAAEVMPEALPGPNNCVASGGRCSSRTVPGGTLYLQLKDFPANYGGVSGFKPGTEHMILSFDDEYVFVPTDKTGYSYTIRMSAAQNHPQYADQPPSGWVGVWPPDHAIGNVETTFNPGGHLLSPDQFAAMVGNPAMAAVGTLLDDKSPAAPAAFDKYRSANAAILAATKGLFPAGTTLAIGDNGPSSPLVLTGPSGANAFTWRSDRQQPTWQHGQACQGRTPQECTATDVPGGQIRVSSQSIVSVGPDPQASMYQPGTDRNTAFADVSYTYLPDDPQGTVVTVMLRAQIKDIPWAATPPRDWGAGDPWPPAARTGEPFNASGALLTPEQFAALARTPDLAQTIGTVNGYLHQYLP